MSEFRVLLENQQLDLVIQLTVSRDKIKDDARRCLLSTFLAPYCRVDSTREHSSLFLCAHFENLKFLQVTVSDTVRENRAKRRLGRGDYVIETGITLGMVWIKEQPQLK